MNKLTALLFFTLFTVSIYAQKPKVFIEFNNESEGWISMHLEESNNWEIVGSFEKSNVVLRVQMSESAYKATGKIYVIDSYTGETIYTSKTLKGQSSAFNGYAPKKNLSKKLVNNLETNFDKSKINLSTFGQVKDDKTVIIQEKDSEDKYDKIKKLNELLKEGILTQEEYEKEKKKLLEGK